MTDLRKAAEMALNALDMYREHDAKNIGLADAAYEALRQALAQPEWVGLTRDEIDYCFEQCVIRKFKEDGTEEGIVSIYKAVEVIEAELKEKNT